MLPRFSQRGKLFRTDILSEDMEINRDTLTFRNANDLSLKEIKLVFGKYGKVIAIRDFQNRIFVRFSSSQEAERAFAELKSSYDLSYANKRSDINPKSRTSQSFEDSNRNSVLSPTTDKEIRQMTLKCSGNSSTPVLSSKMNSLEKSKNIVKESATKSSKRVTSSSNVNINKSLSPVVDFDQTGYPNVRSFSSDENYEQFNGDFSFLPSLIDGKNIPVLYSILLGNLPDKYSLNDVHSLVEEVNPAAFTEMDYTETRKIKFCEVFVRNEEDISYLKEKLDNFVICGRKLIAIEPSELLTGVTWDL